MGEGEGSRAESPAVETAIGNPMMGNSCSSGAPEGRQFQNATRCDWQRERTY